MQPYMKIPKNFFFSYLVFSEEVCLAVMPLKSLLNSEISHRSKFEAIADKKSKGTQVTKFVPDLVQKIVGKGEKSPFSTRFSKFSLQ